MEGRVGLRSRASGAQTKLQLTVKKELCRQKLLRDWSAVSASTGRLAVSVVL